jgi:hypothetical protein
MSEKLVAWEMHETIGLGITNVGQVAKMDITPEMWASICKKAEAEGMDPVEWFDREVEPLNAELEAQDE